MGAWGLPLAHGADEGSVRQGAVLASLVGSLGGLCTERTPCTVYPITVIK